uniref:Uncharacterized protein n=1 Tax=Arundo donax TaxID=35708 RepID=A0A0A9F866_ARUDO
MLFGVKNSLFEMNILHFIRMLAGNFIVF